MAADKDLQGTLDDLLARMQGLTKVRDRLVRDTAALEERRDAALAELAKLGIQAEGMSAKELEALRSKLAGELETKLETLTTLVEKGEALVQQAGY